MNRGKCCYREEGNDFSCSTFLFQHLLILPFPNSREKISKHLKKRRPSSSAGNFYRNSDVEIYDYNSSQILVETRLHELARTRVARKRSWSDID